MSAFLTLCNVFFSIWILLLAIAALNPDVVLASVPPGEVTLGGYFACKVLGKPFAVDYRDPWEDYQLSISRNRIQRHLFGALKRIAARVYANSVRLYAATPSLADRLRTPPVSEVKVIPNGADVLTFKPLDRHRSRNVEDIEQDDLVLVFSGHVGAYYRLDMIVKAVAGLSPGYVSRTRLLVIGDGPDLAGILDLARELSVESRIRVFRPSLEPARVAEILACADIGLIPYDDNILWRDTIPAKFYEYCACGLPVVAAASKGSELARVITEHRLGFVVPPLDVQALTALLSDLAGNPGRLIDFRDRTRDFVVAGYDRDEWASTVLQDLERASRRLPSEG